MAAIGGYFELADYEGGRGFPLQGGTLLNTGRNALEYILRSIDDVKGVYLPYYTCEAVLEPLKKLHIPWISYHIDANFEMKDDIHVEAGEYIIANNYFGIKDAYIKTLADKYADRLIVDCAQAFFAKPIPGIKSFYSPRKYVGVADGGIAFGVGGEDALRFEEDDSSLHNSHLAIRKEYGAEEGFLDYRRNEMKLGNQPIRQMCPDTRSILLHIDYDKIVSKRRSNYAHLHNALKDRNLLHLPEIDSFACPMIYPFMAGSGTKLRKELIDNKIFVATYWPAVHLLKGFETEYDLADRVLAIPCDQRYGKTEMNRIINSLLK